MSLSYEKFRLFNQSLSPRHSSAVSVDEDLQKVGPRSLCLVPKNGLESAVSGFKLMSLCLADHSVLLTRLPSLPVDVQALDYFIRAYIPASHFDYLQSRLDHPSKDRVLEEATSSAALATFSIAHGDASIWKIACQRYASALSLVNEALASPAEAVKDDTLAATLLLSLFEAVSFQDRHDAHYTNWKAHVEGASRLLCIRGRSQLEHELGRQLFVHVSASIEIIAAEERLRLFSDYICLRQDALIYLEGSDAYWRLRFLQLVNECAAVRIRVEEAALHDLIPLIGEASTLDLKITYHFDTMPKAWIEKGSSDHTTFTGGNGEAWPYSQLRIPQIRNALRLLRFLLNQTVYVELTRLQELDPLLLQSQSWPSTSMMKSAEHNIEAMALEIYAHMPEPSRSDAHLRSLLTLSETFSLFWPLVAVAKSEIVTHDLRILVLEKLKRLAENAGLRRASDPVQSIDAFIEGGPRVHMLHII